MIGDRMMRASDEDRHMTVDLLRDAYCAGRLRAEEFYGRLDAAYEAMTRGELDDLTADLPPVWTDAGLPSEFVISQRRSRAAGWHLLRRAIWTCLLALAVGLAARVNSAALWAVFVVPIVLLLPFAAERSRARLRSPESARPACGPASRRQELPGS
jgi:hypothetical protein